MSATLTIIPPQIASGKTLLSSEQASAYLGVARQTMANWRMDGRGPKYVRVGRLVRYRLEALDEWIEKQSTK